MIHQQAGTATLPTADAELRPCALEVVRLDDETAATLVTVERPDEIMAWLEIDEVRGEPLRGILTRGCRGERAGVGGASTSTGRKCGAYLPTSENGEISPETSPITQPRNHAVTAARKVSYDL